jgi:type IV pilus assembly protein PilY1
MRSSKLHSKRSLFFALLLLAGQSLALPAKPVFLGDTVPPNLLITLDDSGSMTWGYVPDGMSGDIGTKRFLAASHNAMAYNPKTIYVAPPKADGTRFSTSLTAAYIDGFRPGAGTRDISTAYRPVTAYLTGNTGQSTNTDQSPIANSPAPAYYYVYDAGIAGCVPADRATSDNCYKIVNVSATSGTAIVSGSVVPDERQNFANWYSFYKVRHLTMKSGLLLALVDLDSKTRVAWQALTSCPGEWGSSTCKDVEDSIYDNSMKEFSAAQRTALFNWVTRSGGNFGTPLRKAFSRAGDYFSLPLTDAANPWLDVPTASTAANVCRLSYHIAFTDGVWNTTPDNEVTLGATGVGNADNSGTTLPDGTAYAPAAPYADTNSRTIADLAFKHWSTDLQPSMLNQAPAYSAVGNKNKPTGSTNNTPWSAAEYFDPRSDPARWQHLVTYTIGLGLTSTLTNPQWQPLDKNILAGDSVGTFGSDAAGNGYKQFATGAVAWPATGDNANPGNVYDLWHAAINGRGEFFAADNARDVYQAFQTILGRISGRAGSSGTAATSSGFVFSSTDIYQSSFSSTNWSGEITSTTVQQDGSLSATPNWNTTATLTPSLAATRNMYVRELKTAANPTPAVIPFKWASMNADTKAALTSSDVVSWLRGDQSLEKDNAACTSGCIYRRRQKLLGDILGSAPVLSFKEDFGYKEESWRPGAGPLYRDYLTAKAARKPVVLVGANDGFVHIFNAEKTGGDELFAFAPGEMVPTLWRLSEQAYVKRAYVDGPITVGDAYLNSAWGTYAVGTLGVGGKSVYALNITNPNALTQSSVMWEFTHADMGHILSKPIIARLPSGVWVTIFSAGYENSSDTAALYTLNLQTGALLSVDKLTPTVNACGGAIGTTKNGLGAPRVFITKDGKFYVYAGDLVGNLWRFEYTTGADPIQPSFSATPMFKACNGDTAPQAITAAPAVISFGAAPMVYFGTGRLFDTGDGGLTTKNSMYAVIDDNVAQTGARTALLSTQTITGSTNTRNITANVVNLVSTRGWYVDLPTTGERMLATPTLLDERVAFNTFSPTTDNCEAEGTSWTFIVDALTGGQLESPEFDINNDGKINNLDLVAGKPPAAIKLANATISGVTALRTLDTPRTGFTKTSGGCDPSQIKLISSNVYVPGTSQNCTPGPTFRSGWRQFR